MPNPNILNAWRNKNKSAELDNNVVSTESSPAKIQGLAVGDQLKGKIITSIQK